MTVQDLIDLGDAAMLQHGKSGELPIKYFAVVSTQLDSNLASHLPAADVEQSMIARLTWRLRQAGAVAVWRAARDA